MQYLGGKSKIRKQVAEFLEGVRVDNQTYFEPFVGGAWVLQEMAGKRIASDGNIALIAMYQALQQGWIPPDFVSKEDWRFWRNKKEPVADPIMAFARFGYGFGGDWTGGYCNSLNSKIGDPKKSVMRQLPKIKDVEFVQGTFQSHRPENCLVYCDPPYQGTTAYGAFDSFDHQLFWNTMREWSKNNTVVISEYSAPEDFVCVKEFESRMGLTTKQDTGKNERPKRIEKLFMHKSLVNEN